MSTCTAAGCNRTAGLLHFPEPLCGRHRGPEQRALLAELDQRAQRVGIRDADSWPYGPNIHVPTRQALVDWAETEGYRLADPRRLCVHWLLGQVRRCGALQNIDHPGRLDTGSTFDHPTCWTRNGRPALLLAQPYHPPAPEWVAAIDRDWPVHVRVEDRAPWYGWDTCGVFITPAEAAA